MIRVTLDSNIYVPALQFGGIGVRLVRMARLGAIRRRMEARRLGDERSFLHVKSCVGNVSRGANPGGAVRLPRDRIVDCTGTRVQGTERTLPVVTQRSYATLMQSRGFRSTAVRFLP